MFKNQKIYLSPWPSLVTEGSMDPSEKWFCLSGSILKMHERKLAFNFLPPEIWDAEVWTSPLYMPWSVCQVAVIILLDIFPLYCFNFKNLGLEAMWILVSISIKLWKNFFRGKGYAFVLLKGHSIREMSAWDELVLIKFWVPVNKRHFSFPWNLVKFFFLFLLTWSLCFEKKIYFP